MQLAVAILAAAVAISPAFAAPVDVNELANPIVRTPQINSAGQIPKSVGADIDNTLSKVPGRNSDKIPASETVNGFANQVASTTLDGNLAQKPKLPVRKRQLDGLLGGLGGGLIPAPDADDEDDEIDDSAREVDEDEAPSKLAKGKVADELAKGVKGADSAAKGPSARKRQLPAVGGLVGGLTGANKVNNADEARVIELVDDMELDRLAEGDEASGKIANERVVDELAKGVKGADGTAKGPSARRRQAELLGNLVPNQDGEADAGDEDEDFDGITDRLPIRKRQFGLAGTASEALGGVTEMADTANAATEDESLDKFTTGSLTDGLTKGVKGAEGLTKDLGVPLRRKRQAGGGLGGVGSLTETLTSTLGGVTGGLGK